MRRLLSILTGALIAAVIQEYRRISVRWLKIQAAIWYVKGVAQARRMAVRVVSVVAALLLATAGFILFHVGLFLWLPVSLAVKGLLLGVLGLIYLLVAWLVIRHLLSERTWMLSSGASELVMRATTRRQAESEGARAADSGA